jgi:AbrB family looped-hinge helix DNA binding protein
MSATVTMDKKGRLVLPKEVRDKAGVKAGSRLVVEAKGEGRIELLDADLLMRRAQELGSKKLEGWDEEGHEAATLLEQTLKDHTDEAR